MILTEKLLTDFNACVAGINFCKNGKLFGFDLDRIDEISGDCNNFMAWLKEILQYNIEYDHEGRIYRIWKESNDIITYSYDEHSNLIMKSYNNHIHRNVTYEYDTDNKLIYEHNSIGFNRYEYDNNNRIIRKLSGSLPDDTNSIVRYEYDDIGNKIGEYRDYETRWAKMEYDDRNNIIKTTFEDGYTLTYKYDEHNMLIAERKQLKYKPTSYHTVEYYDNGQLKQYDSLHIPVI
jgi:YD repeat-containing protein